MSEQSPPGAPPSFEHGLPVIDLNEYGGKGATGERQSSSRRLFMQLLVYRSPPGTPVKATGEALSSALRAAGVPHVIYADTNDPRGLGVLTFSEDPAHFTTAVRDVLSDERFATLTLREDMTMLGRSYSSGHEPRLEWWLLEKPRSNALSPEHAWAIWYPLRRTGAFAKLDPHEQGQILREHAQIGFAYGKQELAHDIRLACHGLDAKDNEFLIGLVGRDLHPLSHVVQSMRKTKQTSEYIQSMGPFFVGYVLHRHG